MGGVQFREVGHFMKGRSSRVTHQHFFGGADPKASGGIFHDALPRPSRDAAVSRPLLFAAIPERAEYRPTSKPDRSIGCHEYAVRRLRRNQDRLATAMKG